MFRALFFLIPSICFVAQIPAQSKSTISSDAALDHALQNNVLTIEGQPFHAVLRVAPEKGSDPAFLAKIEVFWANRDSYRLIVDSVGFGQKLVVDHDRVMEEDRGDFYPDWLHGFVMALLDPVPRATDLHGQNQQVDVGDGVSYSCFSHDERTNGISNDVKYSRICFSGEGPHLDYVVDLTYDMFFKDFKPFGGKQIATNYNSGFGRAERLVGTMVTLETWKPDPAMLSVAEATPVAKQIHTQLVSIKQQESMVESAPKDVTWPGIREGKTEGFMIVHALTDRNGQVREAANFNADNHGVEEFGRDLALKYRFRPLIVDGVPQQMDMPLVIHFTTKITNPIPELDDKTSRKLISACSLPHDITDPASAGQKIVIQIQVSEDGHIMTLGSSDRKIPVLSLFQQFRPCHFDVYKQNGVPTAYHANLTVTAH
jgi:hypothetical protein